MKPTFTAYRNTLGEAGDYEVIMDEDRVAMRREWFEAVFAAGDQRTRSARMKR
jgi:hypothetical protein